MHPHFVHLVSALAIAAVTTFLLGIFVYIRKSGSSLGKTFFLFCMSIAWWSSFQIWHMSSTDREGALLMAQIMEMGAFFIPAFFVHFVSSFLELNLKKHILAFIYAGSTTIGILHQKYSS